MVLDALSPHLVGHGDIPAIHGINQLARHIAPAGKKKDVGLGGDVGLVHRRDVGHIKAVAHPLHLVGCILVHHLHHLVRHKKMDTVIDSIHDSHGADTSRDVLGIAVLEHSLDILTMALKIDGVAGNIIMGKAVLAHHLEHHLGSR